MSNLPKKSMFKSLLGLFYSNNNTDPPPSATTQFNNIIEQNLLPIIQRPMEDVRIDAMQKEINGLKQQVLELSTSITRVSSVDFDNAVLMNQVSRIVQKQFELEQKLLNTVTQPDISDFFVDTPQKPAVDIQQIAVQTDGAQLIEIATQSEIEMQKAVQNSSCQVTAQDAEIAKVQNYIAAQTQTEMISNIELQTQMSSNQLDRSQFRSSEKLTTQFSPSGAKSSGTIQSLTQQENWQVRTQHQLDTLTLDLLQLQIVKSAPKPALGLSATEVQDNTAHQQPVLDNQPPPNYCQTVTNDPDLALSGSPVPENDLRLSVENSPPARSMAISSVCSPDQQVVQFVSAVQEIPERGVGNEVQHQAEQQQMQDVQMQEPKQQEPNIQEQKQQEQPLEVQHKDAQKVVQTAPAESNTKGFGGFRFVKPAAPTFAAQPAKPAFGRPTSAPQIVPRNKVAENGLPTINNAAQPTFQPAQTADNKSFEQEKPFAFKLPEQKPSVQARTMSKFGSVEPKAVGFSKFAPKAEEQPKPLLKKMNFKDQVLSGLQQSVKQQREMKFD